MSIAAYDRAMSLRHALLGLVAVQPGTGYELTQRFDRSLSNAWHAGHSQIYPELSRLHDAGHVEVVGEGARNSRTWGITDDGREELRRWLVETEPNRNVRDESALRLFLSTLLSPAERRAVLERDLAHVEAERQKLLAIMEQLDAQPGRSAFRPLVDLGLRVNPVLEEWLRGEIEGAG
jgi:PadR family transcriptional regulator, regulatory protein AphA